MIRISLGGDAREPPRRTRDCCSLQSRLTGLLSLLFCVEKGCVAIRNPFGGVAGHVTQSKRSWGICTDRSWCERVSFLARIRGQGPIIGLFATQRAPDGIGSFGSIAPGSSFPFGFGGESFVAPSTIASRRCPRDAYHGPFVRVCSRDIAWEGAFLSCDAPSIGADAHFCFVQAKGIDANRTHRPFRRCGLAYCPGRRWPQGCGPSQRGNVLFVLWGCGASWAWIRGSRGIPPTKNTDTRERKWSVVA